MPIHKRFARVVLIALALSTAALNTSAETVLIRSITQAKGQGWLFGSPVDASCWVAVPKHVIAQTLNGPVANFQWTDRQGFQGTGVNPKASAAGLDLAFARAHGREAGECMSRLGAGDLDIIVSKQPTVEAMSMQATHVEPRRMVLRDFNGSILRFEPKTEAAKQRLKPGLSGAPLILREPNFDRPIGLVTSISEDLRYGYAVRFDAIRDAFTEQADASPSEPSPTLGTADFTLTNTTAVSLDLENPDTGLMQESGCWAASPPEDGRSFRTEIVATKPGLQFSNLSLTFDPDCGDRPDAMIVEEQRGKRWQTVADCQLSTLRASCNTPTRNFSRLRLTVIKRNGATVGLSHLQLLP